MRTLRGATPAPAPLCLLALAVLTVLLLGCAAGPALALPEGREYEQVSPQYKGGYGATSIEAVSEDGNSVAFYSPGVFNGAPAGLSTGLDVLAYLARRGSSGWSTVPVSLPDTLTPDVNGFSVDVSPSLGSVLLFAKPGPNNASAFEEGTQVEILTHSTDTPDLAEDWRAAGPLLEPLTAPDQPFEVEDVGTSSDFCHIFVASRIPLLAEAKEGPEQLYEATGGCGGPVELKLVAVNNSEGALFSPLCHASLGGAGGANPYNAVAAEGDEVFFTTCVASNEFDHQLFVRLGGVRTVEVSKPLSEAEACGEAIPCREAGKRASAEFAGASEDGSRLFFTTQAPLTGSGDTSENLYMASIGCPPDVAGCEPAQREVTSLVEISHGSPDCGVVCEGDAEVQGVVRVAPDGQRVYFVARGVLSDVAGPEGRLPARGAENLYVYDGASGEIAFIGDLCSGYDASGSVETRACPATTGVDDALWSGAGEAHTAGAGGDFLVFSSYAQLTADDTDSARDVYRYDAVSGALERVSVGEAGYDANGNNDAFDARLLPQNDTGGLVRAQHELRSRAVSEDGSRIVFLTSEPLSPQATDGLENAYEWHEGKVALVSGGTAETPVEDVTISASGQDVFFVTSQGLVPEDVDGAADVYDAHLCTPSAPCFPQTPAARRPCEGDACQGPLTNPSPLLVPGSATQQTGGDFAAPAPTKPQARAKKKQRRAKHRPAEHRSRAGRRARRISVRASGSSGRSGR